MTSEHLSPEERIAWLHEYYAGDVAILQKYPSLVNDDQWKETAAVVALFASHESQAAKIVQLEAAIESAIEFNKDVNKQLLEISGRLPPPQWCECLPPLPAVYQGVCVACRKTPMPTLHDYSEQPSVPPKDELRALRCDNRDLRSALKNIIEAYTEDKGPTEIARIARAALDTLPIPDFLRNQENLKAERAAVEPLGSRRMGNEPAGDGVTDDTAAIQAIVDGVLPRETGGSQS